MINSKFHIVIINYTYGVEGVAANELLNQTSVLTEWANAVRSAGAKVTVFQRFSHTEAVQRANVTYHLIHDRFGLDLHAWQLPRQLHWSVRVLCVASVNAGYATVVHANRLCYPIQTWHLHSLLPSACALVLQHQGCLPWHWPERVLQWWSLRKADGFLFANSQDAQRWQQARLVHTQQSVHILGQELSTLSSPEPDANVQRLNIYQAIHQHHLQR
ncbi:MAG: hypothetical protein U0350_40170 [Caldilineaceae bacterium]